MLVLKFSGKMGQDEFSDCLNPQTSVQATESKQILSCIKSTPDGLQIIQAYLTLSPFKLVDPKGQS